MNLASKRLSRASTFKWSESPKCVLWSCNFQQWIFLRPCISVCLCAMRCCGSALGSSFGASTDSQRCHCCGCSWVTSAGLGLPWQKCLNAASDCHPLAARRVKPAWSPGAFGSTELLDSTSQRSWACVQSIDYPGPSQEWGQHSGSPPRCSGARLWLFRNLVKSIGKINKSSGGFPLSSFYTGTASTFRALGCTESGKKLSPTKSDNVKNYCIRGLNKEREILQLCLF